MLQIPSERKEIIKKKHQIVIKHLDALHAALTKLNQAYQTSPTYPHVRLSAVRAFEVAFHALCSYMAERVGMIYEFEQPETSAGMIFEAAFQKHILSQEDYVGCLELVAVYGMTGQVFDGDIAEEICHDIDELFPVMCTAAEYTPEDLSL
ncbi:MAG: hypothetical protein AB7F19_01705 [Candidatus Babeliales bacterium]